MSAILRRATTLCEFLTKKLQSNEFSHFDPSELPRKLSSHKFQASESIPAAGIMSKAPEVARGGRGAIWGTASGDAPAQSRDMRYPLRCSDLLSSPPTWLFEVENIII